MTKKGKSKKTKMLPNLLVFGLLRRPRCSADLIHRAYIIYYWRQCRTLRKRLSILKGLLLSPFHIIRDIKIWSPKLGAKAARIAGKSVLRQCLEQFYLGFFYAIDSENYYLQEFFRRDGPARARNFVNKGAIKQGAYRVVASYGKYINWNKKHCSLGKKVEYTEYCLENELPVVPILMEFSGDGRVKDLREDAGVEGKLPEENIFCKPNRDNEGEGAEVWNWKGGGKYESYGGETLSSEELKQRLLSLAARHKSGSYLVQPLIMPHPDLEPFRKKATPTLRILTYLDFDGEVKADTGMLRFSISSLSVVDNASAGGLVAPIDLTKGTLGMATDDGRRNPGQRWERHPDNEARIKGRSLPYWKEVLALVKRAQALFPHYPIIGWDIVITGDGPLLLEGNSQPGLCFLQRAHLTSLGDMEIGAAMAAYCRQAIKVLYGGIIGAGSKGNPGTIDLFRGSRIKRWLSLILLDNRCNIQLLIYGKVQGVGFRYWLQRHAQRSKVDGWVRNRKDGKVEAVLSGRAVDVEDVARLCRVGPEKARVEKVEAFWYREKARKGFPVN